MKGGIKKPPSGPAGAKSGVGRLQKQSKTPKQLKKAPK